MRSFVVLSGILKVPYPILLVVGGLAFSLPPGLPTLELPPDLVLMIFLPPLLYSAAFFSSPRDLRANFRPIAFLSVGLVLLTSVTVAVVGHAVIGLPWPVAFVLGAIVSPTDRVAVSATAQRFGLPRRVVTILEGESLVNDGTALVLYRTAVAAAVAGSFSVLEAGLDFVLSGIGGVAIGLFVGWVVSRVRTWVEDPLLETTIALFTGYAAYLPTRSSTGICADCLNAAEQGSGSHGTEPTPLRCPPWSTASLGFRNRLEGWRPANTAPALHNLVHVWVGGDMLPSSSPNDPVFYLNHCNVDRIWAAWLERNGSTYVPDQTAPTTLRGHRLDDTVNALLSDPVTPRQMLDVGDIYNYDTLVVS